jgi:riboflavin kinase/FMN adenylyltransferase
VEIRRGLSQHDPSSPRTALTIGAYDGVHTGHRQVISEVCRLAVERSLTSAVLTFDRHPASVVRPGSAPLLLTDTDQKLEQLAATGVDLTMVLPFDAERATDSAESFVREVLVGGLGVALVVVGEDFHFGHQRVGNVALLRDLGVELDFEVMGLGLVGLDGRPARDHEQVSSTFVRRALARGDLKRANAMLGRPYEVRGVVDPEATPNLVPGTVRVHIDSAILLPECGYYACWSGDGTGSRTAVAVSVRPLVGGSDAGMCTITAVPIDAESRLSKGPVRLDFVSHLSMLSTDDKGAVSSIGRLHDLLGAAGDALG